MAPWWLRSGNDENPLEDQAPGAVDDAATPASLAAEVDTRDDHPADAGPAESRAEAAEIEESDANRRETGAESSNEEDTEAPRRKRRRRRRRSRKPPEQENEIDAATESQLAEAPPAKTAPAAPEPEMEPAPANLEMIRNLVYPLPERASAISDERKIAMFCDFENIALGVRDSEIEKLDVNLILERLLEKGKIIVKKAYADWERYSEYKKPFHEAAIELIDIPQKYYSGKNSADIKMVVDAMDLCYSKEHLDTFALVSGDSDFSPLVSKLKENNKYVIGVGVKNSSSNLLIDNCDEFIFYEDIWRDIQRAKRLDNLSTKDAEVFGLLIDAMFALIRENKDVLWGSMIKQTMQRKRPSFNEGYYGYNSFSELLEDGQRKNIIRVKRDQRSGNYVVTGFAKQSGKR